MRTFEYLVIGSGASGAMAAQTLVEAGVNVTMLDVGEKSTGLEPAIPDKDFLSIRSSEAEQYKYFIGENGEGIDWTDIGKGAQITPPRQHMLRSVDKLIPLESRSFSPVESLGYGGLGIGWGLQCWEYSKADLKMAGLDARLMSDAYNVVSSRIGISASKDDASRYTLGDLNVYQSSPNMDRNHSYIYGKYLSRKHSLNKHGLHMGRTPLALITKDLEGRKGYKYHDMDYYSDNDQSAWRPWITINELKQKKNFTYIGNHLMTAFKQTSDSVEVTALNIVDNKEITFRCRKLILAASTLGTARIVLRSLGDQNTKLPILCNPYTYIPCLQPKLVGKAAEKNKLGFAQLSLFLDEDGTNFNTSVASLYSYQSLMMFRSIRQMPLDLADARELFRFLMTGLVIMGVHHPDKHSPQKYLQLAKNTKTLTGDKLKASYSLSDSDKIEYIRREKKYIAAMRRMGTFGLKRIDPGNGASIHYAGTLPFSGNDKPFTLTSSGRLHGTRNVYVADSSGFNYLPASGLTFSLMANAHLAAESVLKHEV